MNTSYQHKADIQAAFGIAQQEANRAATRARERRLGENAHVTAILFDSEDLLGGLRFVSEHGGFTSDINKAFIYPSSYTAADSLVDIFSKRRKPRVGWVHNYGRPVPIYPD